MKILTNRCVARGSTFFGLLALITSLLIFAVIRLPFLLEVKDPLEHAGAILVLSGDNMFLRMTQAVDLCKKGYAKYLILTGCTKVVGLYNQDNPFFHQ